MGFSPLKDCLGWARPVGNVRWLKAARHAHAGDNRFILRGVRGLFLMAPKWRGLGGLVPYPPEAKFRFTLNQYEEANYDNAKVLDVFFALGPHVAHNLASREHHAHLCTESSAPDYPGALSAITARANAEFSYRPPHRT